MSVTIKDVALKAAVSKSTVSNVINGHDGTVSPETAQRVLQVIQELGYRPNGIARSLVRRRTDVVGVIVANINRAPYPAAVRGIDDTLGKSDYSILLSSNDDNPNKERKLLRVLHERQVDGIIVVSQSGWGENEYLIDLAKRGLPVVVINRLTSTIEGISTVNIDNTSGAYEATRHLIALGHKHIALLSVRAKNNVPKATIQRQQGFTLAMREAGLDDSIVFEGSFRTDGGRQFGYQTMMQLLHTTQPRPSAVFCVNDFIAFGAMAAAQETGLRLPDDLAIIGHDNTMAAQYVSPTLTSVEQPMYEAGTVAAQMLHNAMSGNMTPQSVTLHSRLVVRESCGGTPLGHPR